MNLVVLDIYRGVINKLRNYTAATESFKEIELEIKIPHRNLSYMYE